MNRTASTKATIQLMPPGTVTAYFYISLKSADLTRPLCESIAGQSFSDLNKYWISSYFSHIS